MSTSFLHPAQPRLAALRRRLEPVREATFLLPAVAGIAMLVLTRLDVAFSRDQDHKIYVQDRMREKGADLFAWLEGRAERPSPDAPGRFRPVMLAVAIDEAVDFPKLSPADYAAEWKWDGIRGQLVRRAGDSLETILAASQKVTGTIQEISAASAGEALDAGRSRPAMSATTAGGRAASMRPCASRHSGTASAGASEAVSSRPERASSGCVGAPPSDATTAYTPSCSTRPREPVPDLWLCAAPLKKGRIDWVAEKACELGVARFVTLTSLTMIFMVLGYVAGILLIRGASHAKEEEEEAEEEFGEKVTREAKGWHVITTSFLILFLAEWGDLSQLATAGFVARGGNPWAVGIAAFTALALVSGLGAAVGRALLNRISLSTIRAAGGVVCLIFAALFATEDQSEGMSAFAEKRKPEWKR